MSNSNLEHRPPDSVEIVKLIKIRALRGNGSEDNPVRRVELYYSLEGQFLFETDGNVNYLM